MTTKAEGEEDLLDASWGERHSIEGRVAVHLLLMKRFGMRKRE